MWFTLVACLLTSHSGSLADPRDVSSRSVLPYLLLQQPVFYRARRWGWNGPNGWGGAWQTGRIIVDRGSR